MKYYKLPLVKIVFKLGILIILSVSISCKKFIEVDAPITNTNGQNIFNSDANAIAALTGIYTRICSNGIRGGINSISLFPALSADELTLFGGASNTAKDYVPYYTNALTSTNTTIDFCGRIYPTIFVANSAIEGLALTNDLTPAVQQQLMGEAKFIRALCYFYLVNLFGDVPLALSTDYKENALLYRTSKDKIYKQIISDLRDAKDLLSNGFVGANVIASTVERIRPTKWAAIALLARVYLYTGDWLDAETEATSLISNTALFSLNNLTDVFKANSKEAIWQLPPVNQGENTSEARLFVLPITGPTNSLSYPVHLSNHFVKSFDTVDQRKKKWIDSVIVNNSTYYYPSKYKVVIGGATPTEYSMVLRLAEQYLIRSEARARLNKLSAAADDLNMIRNRAGIGNTLASTQSGLLTAILYERQIELFTEWGHRWFDLKRTGTVDSVMTNATTQKGGTWNTHWQWYPFPLSELERDPNLIQNSGY